MRIQIDFDPILVALASFPEDNTLRNTESCLLLTLDFRGFQINDCVFQKSHNFAKLKCQVYYQIVLGILANINLFLELASQIWKIEAVLEKTRAK